MTVACVTPAKESPQGHACGLDRVSAQPGRCRVEQGEVGSTLGIKDLGVGWSNVKSSGAPPIGAPTYWWVGIPPGVTPAPRGLQWVSKKVLAASLSPKLPEKFYDPTPILVLRHRTMQIC